MVVGADGITTEKATVAEKKEKSIAKKGIPKLVSFIVRDQAWLLCTWHQGWMGLQVLRQIDLLFRKSSRSSSENLLLVSYNKLLSKSHTTVPLPNPCKSNNSTALSNLKELLPNPWTLIMSSVDDILYSTSISCDCKKLSQTKRSFSLSLPPPPSP